MKDSFAPLSIIPHTGTIPCLLTLLTEHEHSSGESEGSKGEVRQG